MSENVQAEARFINPEWKGRSEIPRIYSKETRYANTTPHSVEILDARPLQERGEIDLDRNGFTLLKHRSSIADFSDAEKFGAAYQAEMQKVVEELTGADQIFPLFKVSVRAANPTTFFGDGYSLYFHCDSSWDELDGILAEQLREAGSPLADNRDGWHFALYNTWRPVDQTVYQNPLTLIDAASLDAEDLINYGLDEGNEGDDGFVAMVPIYKESQRLMYYPYMEPDEVLIFKQADTRRGYAQTVPHTSFRDPRAASDAPRRRSVEMRYICAFRA